MLKIQKSSHTPTNTKQERKEKNTSNRPESRIHGKAKRDDGNRELSTHSKWAIKFYSFDSICTTLHTFLQMNDQDHTFGFNCSGFFHVFDLGHATCLCCVILFAINLVASKRFKIEIRISLRGGTMHEPI